uniref:RING-type domain-containing protein n=1 Tax=Arion vulgaris TaxID=1028688 RepID=A0A0B7AVC5_9EUPU
MIAQNHIESSGSNGRAVQDFIHTLPHNGVQRNDFSHLGINPIHEHDNWDNISVTSISAHSVPFTQTNTYLGREIQSLKSQMNEMKSMIKMTFDLQMDMQRAIRQEVAAAMNNCVAQGATGCSTSVPRPSSAVSDTHCLICLDRHTDTVLYQCGHMCVCFVCGRDLMSRGHKCPVCRAPIKDVIRAYKTNAE